MDKKIMEKNKQNLFTIWLMDILGLLILRSLLFCLLLILLTENVHYLCAPFQMYTQWLFSVLTTCTGRVNHAKQIV